MNRFRITPEQIKAAYPFKKKYKRQAETLNQKAFIKHLNENGYGFFFRIKTTGTYDPKRGFFRKNNELVGLPDIHGYTFKPQPAYIEVKRVVRVEKRKKLIFKVQITDEQKDFLLKAFRAGCLAGVAFNLYDCISIVADNGSKYPRHPRTFCFLPREEWEEYAHKYASDKAIHAAIQADPVRRLLEHETS